MTATLMVWSTMGRWNSRLNRRRRFLAAGVSGMGSVLGRGRLVRSAHARGPATTLDPIAELIKLEVGLAMWVRNHRAKILSAPRDKTRAEHAWVDYGFRWPAFTLTHLCTTRHSENPLFNEEWCAELAMQLIDKDVDFWHYAREQGDRISTGETPHYVAAFVLERLSDRISNRRRERWLEHEQAWVDQARVRPLGITGGYHDSWRMTGLYRLGEVLDQPRWCESAVFLFKQLLARQTREGFWEDGPHHGPSARYCGLMLPSLAWMYRWTGDDEFGDSARRLADFMATYVYSDGITVGPFDGRNSNVMGYFPICPGLELTRLGRAYAARAFDLWRDLGVANDVTRAAQSTRDLVRVAFYAADTCAYLDQYAAKPDDAVAPRDELPIDRDGVIENHTSEFDGLMVRRGPWIVSLSSQNSNVRGVHRLERQSRFELWHERARLMVGGGHSHPHWPVPHANVVLDNGYAGRSHFGAAPPGETRRISRHYFRPRRAISSVFNGMPQLTVVFGHGTVRFRFLLNDRRSCHIEAVWNVRGADRICLQLPIVVWRGATLSLDGQEHLDDAYALRKVVSTIQVEGGPFDSSIQIMLPDGIPARVHYPLLTGVFHAGSLDRRTDDPIRNWYDLALVSCQWSQPERTGRAAFHVNVEP